MKADGINLTQLVEDIQSREDFIFFLKCLLEDFKAMPNQWENNNLADYLEGMSAWVADMDGYYANIGEATPEKPDWKVLGSMLLAAKFYE